MRPSSTGEQACGDVDEAMTAARVPMLTAYEDAMFCRFAEDSATESITNRAKGLLRQHVIRIA